MRFFSRLFDRPATPPTNPAVVYTCETPPTIELHTDHADVHMHTHAAMQIMVEFSDECFDQPLAVTSAGWGYDAASNTFRLDQRAIERRSLRQSDLTVFVPEQATVILRSAGGDLHLTGRYQAAHLETAGGDIDTRDAVATSLTIDTAGGDVEATAHGATQIRSAGGDIDVDVTGQATVQIQTTGGDVDIEIHAACTIEAVTHGGDIDVRIDRGYETDVDATTTIGDIKSDIVFSANDGDAAPVDVSLRLRSYAGDIDIRQG
jgi:DUF4097 and DUF4098 domain-containing protein YvlB